METTQLFATAGIKLINITWAKPELLAGSDVTAAKDNIIALLKEQGKIVNNTSMLAETRAALHYCSAGTSAQDRHWAAAYTLLIKALG